jgi:hypothetical protein
MPCLKKYGNDTDSKMHFSFHPEAKTEFLFSIEYY